MHAEWHSISDTRGERERCRMKCILSKNLAEEASQQVVPHRGIGFISPNGDTYSEYLVTAARVGGDAGI